jgi:serine/threonine protein kinase
MFNDGTNNLPPDVLAESSNSDGGTNIALLVVLPLALVMVLGVVVFLFYENRRKTNDAVWVVDKEALKFADPPEIIGRGTFGLVLLAEYRGTQVAVKRVIPPKDKNDEKDGKKGADDSWAINIGTASTTNAGMSSGVYDRTLSVASSGTRADSEAPRNSSVGMTSWGGASLSASGVGTMFQSGFYRSGITQGKSSGRSNKAAQRRKMKKEFIDEMRYLSKLRHPCITTVMGAITKGEPMLVMEYMDHGSLYDLLHNETMVLEGEILLPLLRDITQVSFAQLA